MINQNHVKTLVLSSLTFLLAACATGTPINTPSGLPEALFDTDNKPEVLDRIASGCADRGLYVTSQTGTHVMCERTMDDLGGVFAQALLGNSYSTTPQMRVRFSAFQAGNQVRVQAHPWVETQMALGQIQRADIRTGKTASDIQTFLNDLARTVERPAPETANPDT
tara:strand:+ start:72 stop:569 length:498 start_codon:yes stop_codon:yes gene_type:complete